jgi:outer membrane protein TolC
MHNTSLHRIAFLALALGTAGLSATFAQAQTSDNTTTPAPPMFHHHASVLTPDEQAQLKKDYDEALANNADLKTASDNLKQQEEALHQEAKALHEKLHAAMLAEDPSVGPILDKLKAAHKGGFGHHHHGENAPEESSSTTSTSNQ